MNSLASTTGVPRWFWWTLAGVTVGSIAGVALFAGRSPSWDRMIRRTGAPEPLQILGKIQRYTESRGNPKAGLGRPELFPWWAQPSNAPRARQESEADAAARGYDRNESYQDSPYPPRMWIFGSGGAYGLLPSTALAPWRRTDTLRQGRVTPYDVFNPWRSTIFFVDYAHRLVKRYFDDLPEDERTIMAIKRGMAASDLTLDYDYQQPRSRKSRQNSLEAVEALGLHPSVLDTPVPLHWPNYKGATRLIP